MEVMLKPVTVDNWYACSPASGRIMIGHRPENHAAAALYESLGFKKVSEELIDGEIVRLLQVG